MACLLKLPDGSQVWIVNTHLGCHFIGEQAQQVRELVLFVNSLDRNSTRGVIVCGDFNTPPFYQCIKYMKRCGLRDLWKCHGRGWGGTFPSESKVLGISLCANKLLRLDYIFVLEGILMSCKHIHVQGESLVASDHLPLCAALVIMQHQYKIAFR
jgi:endonuclease/exonuclease/phosphatase family metal-dependent hydrolase